jgi:hypothetical protein
MEEAGKCGKTWSQAIESDGDASHMCDIPNGTNR